MMTKEANKQKLQAYFLYKKKKSPVMDQFL